MDLVKASKMDIKEKEQVTQGMDRELYMDSRVTLVGNSMEELFKAV